MDYKQMKDIASENGLQFVETTVGFNGYPQNVKGAIIGFDDFEQAEALAKETGLGLQVISKKDGWNLWYRGSNTATEPLTITEEDFGDDFNFITDGDEKDFYENEVKPFLDDFDNLDDLMEFLEQKQEIADELNEIGDGYVVVTQCGKYYDTINTRPMRFNYDGEYWEIALVQ